MWFPYRLNDFPLTFYAPHKSSNFYPITNLNVVYIKLHIQSKFRLCGSHKSGMTFIQNFVSRLGIVCLIRLLPNLVYIYKYRHIYRHIDQRLQHADTRESHIHRNTGTPIQIFMFLRHPKRFSSHFFTYNFQVVLYTSINMRTLFLSNLEKSSILYVKNLSNKELDNFKAKQNWHFK